MNRNAPNLVNRNVQIDFGTVKGVLPYGIVPSDLDGMIEYKDNFLVIEAKFGKVELSTGQFKMLRALSSIPDFLVVVVAIEEVETVKGVYKFLPTHWRYFKDGKLTEWKAITLEKFHTFLALWFEDCTQK